MSNRRVIKDCIPKKMESIIGRATNPDEWGDCWKYAAQDRAFLLQRIAELEAVGHAVVVRYFNAKGKRDYSADPLDLHACMRELKAALEQDDER